MKKSSLGTLAFALLVAACGGSSGPPSEYEPGKGAMQLPLLTSSSEGKTYRLVGATFELTGPQNATITDISEETLSIQLPTGLYYIELKGDYHLEEVTAGEPGKRIEALMISPNPLQFTIAEKETTTVQFIFKIVLPGTVDVGIRVDKGGWITGQVEFTKVYQGGRPCSCVYMEGQSRPFAFSFESVTLTRLAPGPDGTLNLEVTTGPLTPQFGGDYLEPLHYNVGIGLSGHTMTFKLSAQPDSNSVSLAGLLANSNFGFRAGPVSPAFTGTVDSQGYPTPQAFQFDTTVELGALGWTPSSYSSKVEGRMVGTGFIPKP
ncbi:hypothetical protein HUA74_25370 [Myxococcus sp. CA051A]|uniref:hypothetical protein n=1 Tax=Myxococcus sp. CA051A TaxID=2741739 RepID=UPI00157AD6C4|nr:hypothetical protein [Myxococcus sp. CA051A]NTX63990.1 hypothetical protein [Myxococcus sp. CA051A]